MDSTSSNGVFSGVTIPSEYTFTPTVVDPIIYHNLPPIIFKV